MTPTRKIITGFITVLALAGCFIAFKKESASVVAKQSLQQQGQGSTILVDGAQESATTLPIASTDYSTSAMSAHTELTPVNIIWFTNYYRVQNNLPPLSESPELSRSSADKSEDMFEFQYFDHTRPGTDQTFDVFFDKEGYNFIKIGENLAMGNFKTSENVVDAWMTSPEHKRNILDTVYTDIGVSVQTGTMDGIETYVIVEHFGKPRSQCPSVDINLQKAISSLKSEITATQDKIESEEGEVAAATSTNSSDSIVEGYDSLVDSYNSLTTQLSGIVSSYNQQVIDYNKCIQGK